jgi:two-component system sensor histidine kinase GlrK
MRLPRPRTLLGIILLGLGMVTLPLLIAVGRAAIQLDELVANSEAVVRESIEVTEQNQRLSGNLKSLERNARSWVRVGEPDYLDLYRRGLTDLQLIGSTLLGLPQDKVTAGRLQVLIESALELQTLLETDTASSADTLRRDSQVIGQFDFMNAAALDVDRGMRRLITAELNALEEEASTSQQNLVWQAAALVPATLLLVVFFLFLVGRPMRQLDRAISELGQGRFTQTIDVSGPRDLATLGSQLEWLRQRLLESTEEKNKFLRHMSHELKTPLANIREGTELLIDGSVGKLDGQQKEVTSILRENGVKLQRLIENLLTFSDWQTQAVDLDITDFELKPLVFSILSQHRLTISQLRIKLKLVVSPIQVRGDEGKIRLVLENLISNAIKFSPAGGTLFVGAQRHGKALIIEVADSGPGVAPEDRERIFEAFYQGKRPQGGHVGGTGIGLSVVSECVQAHGGNVELVQDGQWSGAHFRVSLPVPEAEVIPLVAHG